MKELPFLGLLILAAMAAADERPLPPLEALAAYGCAVELVSVIDHNRTSRKPAQMYKATAWAVHRSGDKEARDWQHTLSYRRRRLACLKDCDHWLEQMERAVNPKGDGR